MTPTKRRSPSVADRNVERMLSGFGREPGRVEETLRRVLEASRLRTPHAQSQAVDVPVGSGRRRRRPEAPASRPETVTTRREFADLYEELRSVAARLVSRQPRGGPLDADGLVHDVYVDLAATKRSWRDRDEFLGAALSSMRRIMVESATRLYGSRCRPGPAFAPADLSTVADDRQPLDLIALDESLRKLAAVDERAARVVEFRILGSLKSEEIGRILGVPMRCVERDWKFARAWLRAELE